jgi:hypothetical protein
MNAMLATTGWNLKRMMEQLKQELLHIVHLFTSVPKMRFLSKEVYFKIIAA